MKIVPETGPGVAGLAGSSKSIKISYKSLQKRARAWPSQPGARNQSLMSYFFKTVSSPGLILNRFPWGPVLAFCGVCSVVIFTYFSLPFCSLSKFLSSLTLLRIFSSFMTLSLCGISSFVEPSPFWKVCFRSLRARLFHAHARIIGFAEALGC